jgi:hypothetical protein
VEPGIGELRPPAQPLPRPRNPPDVGKRAAAGEHVGAEPLVPGELLVPDSVKSFTGADLLDARRNRGGLIIICFLRCQQPFGLSRPGPSHQAINAKASARCTSLATTALTRLAVLPLLVMTTSVPISSAPIANKGRWPRQRFRLVLRGVGGGRQFLGCHGLRKKV